MDWADDIAYSVHDLEDFHRCAALPWARILSDDGVERLVARANANWWNKPTNAEGRLRGACRRLVDFLQGTFPELLFEPYEGTRKQRQQLRTMTSALIGRYIRAVKLRDMGSGSPGESSVDVADDAADEVKILKQITRDYI